VRGSSVKSTGSWTYSNRQLMTLAISRLRALDRCRPEVSAARRTLEARTARPRPGWLPWLAIVRPSELRVAKDRVAFRNLRSVDCESGTGNGS
jgi:hypothetical protein